MPPAAAALLIAVTLLAGAHAQQAEPVDPVIESQCRPYVEKALREFGTGDHAPGGTEEAQDQESAVSPESEAQIPSEESLERHERSVEEGASDEEPRTSGEGVAGTEDGTTSEEVTVSAEDGTASAEPAASTEEETASKEGAPTGNVSTEEVAASGEIEAENEDQEPSVEDSGLSGEEEQGKKETSAEESPEEEQASGGDVDASEEIEQAKSEDDDTSVGRSTETVGDVTSKEEASAEETAASTEEGAASTEESAAITEEGPASIEGGEASTEEGAASTEEVSSTGGAADSAEEGAASAEEGATSDGKGTDSAEEGVASAEQGAVSVEEGAASAEEGAASHEEEAASAEERAASAEEGAASAEEGAASAEEDKASTEERTVDSEERPASREDVAASLEEEIQSKEQASATTEKSEEESAAQSAEEGAPSTEGSLSAEEVEAVARESAPSAEGEESGEEVVHEGVESAEKEESVESKTRAEEGKSVEDDTAASTEQQSGSVEEAVSKPDETASAEEVVPSTEEPGPEVQTTSEQDLTASAEKASDVESEAVIPEDSEGPASEKTESDEEQAASPEREPIPEEDLIQEMEIPENLRSREHISQILHLDTQSAERELLLERAGDIILRDLKRLYDNAIKPLETLYKYRDLSNRHFGDPEIFSKPLILFMGPWSGGKSSIINYLLDNEYTPTALRTGAEPSPAYFNILMWGDRPEVQDGTQLAADWTFSGLQKFGQGLLDRLRGLRLPNKLLEKVNIVEIPGILEIRKQVERLFPFNDACQWFIDRADIIFLVYDPAKLDVGPETEAILDQLKGRESQTRIILNKADQVKPEELMRVQGTLIWNISPLMSSPEPPVMYSTSLWSLPYEQGAPARLLYAQERVFLRDMRTAIDRRVENKIASARRFAVRVRNHAKMVDCYLTTYYNHKGLFGNRKRVSDEIIERPQDYHIYEGLSTLTNISRYDLPDPEVYRDFFRLNPLYDFPLLSSTCTYFRGCPINRLDVAIAYDLPELVGKYRKAAEEALAQLDVKGQS